MIVIPANKTISWMVLSFLCQKYLDTITLHSTQTHGHSFRSHTSTSWLLSSKLLCIHCRACRAYSLSLLCSTSLHIQWKTTSQLWILANDPSSTSYVSEPNSQPTTLLQNSTAAFTTHHLRYIWQLTLPVSTQVLSDCQWFRVWALLFWQLA